ncbi:MAG: hypothetical protein AAB864_01165 [Patescibacteria group bacterium]
MSEHRWLLILVVIVVAANIFVGSYLWWSQKTELPVAHIARSVAENTPGEEDLPVSLRLTRVNSERVLFPTITRGGNVRFWDAGNATFAESKPDGGQYQTLATLLHTAVRDVVWSPDGFTIAALVDSAMLHGWQLFDLRTESFRSLPANVLAVAFSPKGDEVVYLENDGARGRIVVTLADGTGAKEILATRMNSAELSWPTPERIALIATDSDGLRTLYLLGLDGRLVQVIQGRSQLHAVWSSDGSRVLLSWFEDGSLHTSIITLATAREDAPPITTLASKCAWSTVTAFVCGMPKTPLSSEGYGNTVVPDVLAVTRMTNDTPWVTTTYATTPLSVRETLTHGGWGVVRNAYDGLLWSFIIPQ